MHGGFEPEYAAQPLDSLITLDLSPFQSKVKSSNLQQQQQQQNVPSIEQSRESNNNRRDMMGILRER